MISEFVTGRYYRCIVSERQDDWNFEGEMDAVIGRGSILCKYGDGKMAMFDCVPRQGYDAWTWGLDQWVEGKDDLEE